MLEELHSGNEMVLLGAGILGWDKKERETNRFGEIILDGTIAPRSAYEKYIGVYGELAVRIVEVNDSSFRHGDGIFAIKVAKPRANMELSLGKGYLFSSDNYHFGIRPENADKKSVLWMKLSSLFTAEGCKVHLYFILDETENLEAIDVA